ncbi:replication protein A 70 kDa DNA-binding subunit A-like [Silene latifolia]|uniref:replication protein A 70 kDa DNA-binding subunit A-like n=1 Tax=Silene latifolia TaxID=37657 RepID=UPI003D77F04F
MIKFLYNTYIKVFEADEAIIPKHRFDFLKFHNISNRRGNHSVLTDLIGVVKKEHVKPNYFALEIEDEGGERVRVTLWDQCRSDYQKQKEKLTDGTQTKVVIITSLLVKDYNGYNSISTSNSSSLYVNLDVP